MTTLEFTPEAEKVIQSMRDRIISIGQFYGDESKEYAEAAGSLANVLATMIRLGGRITAAFLDSRGLSLDGSSDYIAYGVVWFPGEHRPEHADLDPTGAFTPGTWSVHS